MIEVMGPDTETVVDVEVFRFVAVNTCKEGASSILVDFADEVDRS